MMKMRSAPGVACAVVFLCYLSACGHSTPTSPDHSTCSDVSGPITLGSGGDVFRVKFTVPATETSDVVLLIHMGFWNGVARTTPDWRAQFRLSDGATFLGVFEVQDTVGFFKSPESTLGSPGSGYWFSSEAGVADFRSIVSGTIDGRVDLSITSGAIVLGEPNRASVTAYGPSGRLSSGVPAQVTARQLCR